MTYPTSSDVVSGMATLASHYNTLRADALRFGQAAADAANLGAILSRYSQWVRPEYLATNKIRVPYSATRPPSLMVNGYLLTATANVDLAAAPSGPAQMYYIFAVRTAASTTFTIGVNTSSTEAADQRLIGQFYWDGTNIDQGSIKAEELDVPNYIFTGADAQKSTAPEVGDIYLASDNYQIYICYVAGTWRKVPIINAQADGFSITAGTTERSLTITGGDIQVNLAGANSFGMRIDADGTAVFEGGGTVAMQNVANSFTGANNFSAGNTFSAACTFQGANTFSGSNNFTVTQYLNESSNADMSRGLTINQGGFDNEILALKSSDVAHSFTNYAEADTFASFRKSSAAEGGLAIRALSEMVSALKLQAYAGAVDTGKSTAAVGAIHAQAGYANGNDVQAMTADSDLFTIANNTNTRFIFDAEGSAHADVEWTTYDTHDDVGLLDALEAALTARQAGREITREFGQFLAGHRLALQAAGIVNFYDEGPRAMVNFTRLSMLQTGAIRQLAARLQETQAQLSELQGRKQPAGLLARIKNLIRA